MTLVMRPFCVWAPHISAYTELERLRPENWRNRNVVL